MTEPIIARLQNLKQAKAKDLVKSSHSASGSSHKVNKLVEQVMTRLTKDLESYRDPKNPDLFKIVSGYRSADEQKDIWDRETKKLEDIIEDQTKKKEEKSKKFDRKKLIAAEQKLANLDKFIAKPAAEGETKITPHMTGLVVDVNLGYPTKAEYIAKIEATDAYDKFSRYAYHTYKMAPYDVEPWHWECGDACQKNIKKILDEEKASGGTKKVSNTPLPPPMPKSALQPSTKDTDIEVPLDCDGIPIAQKGSVTVEEERQIVSESGPIQKILTICVVTSMVCGIHYLVSKNKQKLGK